MLKREAIIIGCCLLVFSCCHRRSNNLLLKEANNNDTTVMDTTAILNAKIDTIEIDTTCIKQPLLNCLLDYIKSCDTVQNIWKVAPIYLIRFYLEDGDTILYLSGHKTRPRILPPPENKGLELKGFIFIKDNPIVIIDNAGDIGSYFYNRNKLQENFELLDKGRDLRDFENKTLPVWIYKVENETQLRLIMKREGRIMK